MFKKCRKLLNIFIIIAIIIGIMPATTMLADQNTSSVKEIVEFDRSNSYENYIAKNGSAPSPNHQVLIPAASYTNKGNAAVEVLGEFKGVKDALCWTNHTGWVEWTVEVPETGIYEIGLKYYPLEGKRRDIELELAIDGIVPFNEARSFLFHRVWKDETDIGMDANGNEYSPRQIESPDWIEADFKDTEGLYNDAYKFYFSKGTHTIRLTCIREIFALEHIKIYKKPEIPSYEQVLRSYNDKGYEKYDGEIVKIQAEKTYLKSDQVLRPLYDRTSPLTEPYHKSKIRLNIIGQQSWQLPAQWINWKFDVPEKGLYKIGFRYQQGYVRGMFTTRRLYINGKIPFKEMETIRFPYGTDWSMNVLGGEDPYLFYLDKGTHELKLEVVLGDMANTIRKLQDVVYDLNDMYRKIIMITSTQPDPYRDYNLDREVPGMIKTFEKNREVLFNEAKHLENVTGQKGSEGVLLENIARQLEDMVKEPDSIPQRLENFKSNVGGMSAWLLDIKNQPLDLDYIAVMAPEQKAPRAKASFIKQVVHEVNAFIASFFEKYNMIGNNAKSDKTITLWLSWGRDQAQVLKTMIDDVFTPETGISVKMKLVQASMIQAVLSGEGPDVAVMVARGQPVNLAIRGALADISQFADFGEVKKQFAETALLPYEFNGGTYGLPDTQMFHMMFYRKDILAELGVEPPQTWEDLYKIAPVIQRNNMEVGIPYVSIDGWGMIDQGMGARNIFPALLMQNGGKFYKSNHSGTALEQPEALEAFKQWAGFYSQYSFPLTYDFYNRFRTGEMPLAIAPYGEYNRLSVAAPEIRNLWDMVPIPGTKKIDGTIDRSVGGSGTATVILSRAANKDACWEFLKWWTGTEAQERFARGLETLMGTAARHSTANLEAFNRLPWSHSELQNLHTQWKYVVEVPEVPGGYYMVRGLDNAFREVVLEWKNPREALNKWNKETDQEIKRKREEFGLDK